LSAGSADIDPYRRLQEHLDKLPVGFPRTKSGVDIRILKHIFTPTEAKIATKLEWSYETAQAIYGRAKELGMTAQEFEQALDNMVSRGEIKFKKEGSKKLYAADQFGVGIHDHQLKRLTPEYYRDIVQFGVEGGIKLTVSTKIPQLRIIPIEISLTPIHYVPRYEDVRKIVQDSEGPFSLEECICRKGMRLIGNPCKKTSRKETCIGLGGPVIQTYLDQGWGREINREEILEVIQKNEEDGLVLQAGNTERPEYICGCCSCCCAMLVAHTLQTNPAEIMSSNYRAEVDPDRCAACGTCVKRCQMNAVKVVDDVAKVNLKRCIGCGLCVPTCEAKAIHLAKKDKQIMPPKSTDELFQIILDGKTKLGQNASTS
jgi:electron transport complex protein RnfB